MIDKTLNIKAAALFEQKENKTRAAENVAKPKAQTFIPVQFFANETSSLPHVVHIGDIIRVHRV